MDLTVHSTADPRAFAEQVAALVERDPVAAAMHTPPRPPHLGTDDPAVGRLLADHLAKSGREVTGVGGFRNAVDAFSVRWQQLRACTVSTDMAQGVYEATAVTRPDVPGRARRAGAADRELLNRWAVGFVVDVGEPPPARSDLLDDRIDAGEMWVWQHGPAPVSMAHASPAYGGMSRVGWVYTPPERRRHGYAAAVVADVTAARLADGHRCMLFTDLANPTSNRVYQQVGYRRVGDALSVSFTGHGEQGEHGNGKPGRC